MEHECGTEQFIYNIFVALSALSLSLMLKVKVKNTALDLTVHTGGANLCFLALQPGSAIGAWGPTTLCFRTASLFIFPRFLQVPI